MRYMELEKLLKEFTVFSFSDIRRIDENFHKRRLNEWRTKKYIKKIIRGYYIFSDVHLNESILFMVANKIYKPSYISLEMALSYYNLIPESVYGVTSVSTRKTIKFETDIGTFIYKALKPELFWGYELIKQNNQFFKIASIEKTILDYFYINNKIKNIDDYESLRINKEIFYQQVDQGKLKLFLKRFAQKALTKRVNLFLEFINNA